MKKLRLLGIALLFTFVLIACRSAPEAKVVTLIAEDIVWYPPLIEVQVGQEIQLTIRNNGALDHNFVSDDLGINEMLSPGESQTLSFVLTEVGSLIFICSIPGHEEAGMAGEIVVTK